MTAASLLMLGIAALSVTPGAVAPGVSQCYKVATTNVVCVGLDLNVADVAESYCGGAITGANCWRVRIDGDHTGNGGVLGTIEMLFGGSAWGGDSCTDGSVIEPYGSCETQTAGYFYVPNSAGGCIEGIAMSRSTLNPTWTVSDSASSGC